MIESKCKLKLEDIHLGVFLEEISEVVSTADIDGNIIFMNTAGLRLLQYSESEMKGLNIKDLHTESTYKYLEEVGIPIAISDGSWKGETTLVRKDRSIVDVLQVIVSHRNDNGDLEYLSTVLKDISQEKSIEKSLQKSEEYREILFSRTFAPNIIIDPKKMCIVECNEAAASVFGFSDKEDLKRTSIVDVTDSNIFSDEKAKVEADKKIEQALCHGESYFKWNLIRADGTPWIGEIHLIAIPWGEKILLQAFIKDVTEEVRNENEKKFLNKINNILISTESYREMLENILYSMMDFFDSDRIWLLKPISLKKKIFEIPMAISKPQWSGKSDMCGPFVVDEETRKITENVLKSDSSLIHGRFSEGKEPEGVAKSLGVRSEIFKKIPIVDGKPWILGLQYCQNEKLWTKKETDFFEEVSNTVAQGLNSWLLNNQLQESKEYISKILDSMPSIIIGIDDKLNITHWNHVAQDKIGFSANEVIGEKLHDVVPEISVSSDEIIESIGTGELVRHNREKITFENITSYIDTIVYPVLTEKLNGAVIRIDDVTEKVRLQENVIKADKMSAINGLAAGIAHEIKNPLAGVMQTIQVMENRLKLDSEKNREVAEKLNISMDAIREYVSERNIDLMMESVKISGKRADSIINNMLNFTRTESERVSQNSVIDILDDAIELASNDYILKTKCEFYKIHQIREYEDNIPYINCEPVKLKVAFFNLIKNGAEAMYKKSFGSDRHPEFRFTVRKIKKYIEIEIWDNGIGIEDTNLKKIFDPFYSTKPDVYGTGLSLPISYYIIRDYHDGDIVADSSEGEWTKFTIRIPFSSD